MIFCSGDINQSIQFQSMRSVPRTGRLPVFRRTFSGTLQSISRSTYSTPYMELHALGHMYMYVQGCMYKREATQCSEQQTFKYSVELDTLDHRLLPANSLFSLNINLLHRI